MSFVMVLTASINPRGMTLLKLTDPQERRKQLSLTQERLKQVKIAPIDKRDFDCGAAHRARRIQSREPAADDENAMIGSRGHSILARAPYSGNGWSFVSGANGKVRSPTKKIEHIAIAE